MKTGTNKPPRRTALDRRSTTLFIPGPVEVDAATLREMSGDVMNHRGPEYKKLHAAAVDKIRRLFRLRTGKVFLVSSSSSGLMEGTVRNLVEKEMISATCGFFSERWHKFALANGKNAVPVAAEWGRAVKPEMLEAALRRGRAEAVALCHCETSTGLMQRMDEIAEVMRRFPETLWIVDAVSTLGAVDLDIERLGIDCVFAGVQKGFALPPGFTVVWVSDRAFDKARRVSNRGMYFDFLLYEEFARDHVTPFTPALSFLRPLNRQLDRMLAEGMAARQARIEAMAKRCRAWAVERGFRIFPEAGYEAVTLTCFEGGGGRVNLPEIKAKLLRRGFEVANSYPPIQDRVLRIGHMGAIDRKDLERLLSAFDSILRGK
jgi:aspartate aminotransferase-like enzyme